jgi:hypothetical protein
MQSICEQLLYEKVKQRRVMHHLKFIWIERDPELMQESTFVRRTSSIGSMGSLDNEDYLSSHGSRSINFDDILFDDGPIDFDTSLELYRSTLDHETQIAHILEGETCVDIVGQLLSVLPPSTTSDQELEALYQSGEFSIDACDILTNSQDDYQRSSSVPNECEENRTKQKRRPSFIVDDETSFAENDTYWLSGASKANGNITSASKVYDKLMQVLDLQIYLTSKKPGIENIPNARFGRPDVKKLFLEMKRDAIDSGETYVAVCVSAPKALTDKCREACRRYSDNRVQFDFHTEVMSY